MAETESVFAGKTNSMVLTATVQIDNARADGQTANRIVYTLMDGQIPVAGQYITFTAFSDSNGAQLSHRYAMTNASGSVVLEVTNTAVETVLISAESAASSFDTVPVEINFVAVETSYTLESIITVNNAAADGVSENKVMFILQDTLGNPVPRKLLEFIPSTGLSLSDKYKETDDNGTAVIGCSTLQMGSYIINAAVYGEETTHRVAGLIFIEGDVLDALTGIVIKDNATSDGEDYCEIQYRLTRQTARGVVANQKIILELNSITALPLDRTIVTDYAGIAVARILNTVAESVIVSAHTEINGLSERTTITFDYGEENSNIF
jgi:adhesin/invasin